MSTPFRDPIIYPGEPLPEVVPGQWIRTEDGGWAWRDATYRASA